MTFPPFMSMKIGLCFMGSYNLISTAELKEKLLVSMGIFLKPSHCICPFFFTPLILLAHFNRLRAPQSALRAICNTSSLRTSFHFTHFPTFSSMFFLIVYCLLFLGLSIFVLFPSPCLYGSLDVAVWWLKWYWYTLWNNAWICTCKSTILLQAW